MAVKCGACKGYHDSAAETRACSDRKWNRNSLDQIAEIGRASVNPRSASEKEAAADARRANPTWAETEMANLLSDGMKGFVFEREMNVLGFIVDFLCRELGLIIEVDGGYHAERTEYDSRRDQIMSANHYMVIRVTNEELGTSVIAVRQRIREAVLARAHELRRTPVRQGLATTSRIRRPLPRIGKPKRSKKPPPTPAPKPKSRVISIPRPVPARKRKFCCTRCTRNFVDYTTPMPACRRCKQSDQLRFACWTCDKLTPDNDEYCFECAKVHKDLRGISKNEAAVWKNTGNHSRGT